MRSHAVITIGAPRSGTSSVAQALQALGVYLGEPDALITGDVNNQDGYFENREFAKVFGGVEITKNRFAEIVQPMPDGWESYPRIPELLTQFRQTIRDQFNGRPLWGWKTPVTTSQIPFGESALKAEGVDFSYVICLREPVDSARSMENKFGITYETGLGIWTFYTLEALATTRGKRATVVPFPEVVNEPRRLLAPVFRHVGGHEPVESQWEALGSLFKPSLVRQRAAQSENPPAMVAQAYRLARACLEPKELDSGRYDADILDAHAEMTTWNKLLNQPRLHMHSLSLGFEGQSGPESKYINYRPNGTWQTFSFELNPRPKSNVSVDFYFLPAHIWIASAIWKGKSGQERASISSSRHGFATKEGRYTMLNVVPGDSQCIISGPSTKGPATLELKFMVETNPLLQAETVGQLVRSVEASRLRPV